MLCPKERHDMDYLFYHQLTSQSIKEEIISRETARNILLSKEIELLPLLNAAYEVRKNFTGKDVMIHIINNAQNGYCPEDCHYCAQAKTSQADIEEYPLKSDEEFLEEAKIAYERGAHRYCLVFAGRGPSIKRVLHLARLIREIKTRYPIEVCVSAGILNTEKAKILKDAGLDRLNHNLNTSERHYPSICSTHTYQDRVNTLHAAKEAGIRLCSGIIAGMGETLEDILEVAYALRELGVISIPVNFLMPIPGNVLNKQPKLTPEFCLRILCLFRFLNPKSELRMAAGREIHLRSLEVMGLYPANSLFLDGYLNTKGAERIKTLQMIKDAGFTIRSTIDLDQLIEKEGTHLREKPQDLAAETLMKGLKDLRPALA